MGTCSSTWRRGFPATSVRLGTLRRGVFGDDFKRMHLESIGIDFGPLVAMQVPQGLFGRAEPTRGYDPAVVAEFAAIGAAKYAQTVCMLFEHVLARRGTWRDYGWMLDVAETGRMTSFTCAAMPVARGRRVGVARADQAKPRCRSRASICGSRPRNAR